MSENTVHCYIIFSGTVQGVGFRYTASRIARSLSLGGFVKNLSDGNVEVQLAGDRETIGLFIEGIQDSMRGHITDMETDWGEAKDSYTGFEIKFL